MPLRASKRGQGAPAPAIHVPGQVGSTAQEGVSEGAQASDETRVSSVVPTKAAATAAAAAPRPQGHVPIGARRAETAAVPQRAASAAAAPARVMAPGDPTAKDVAARLHVGAGLLHPTRRAPPRSLPVAGVLQTAIAQAAPAVRGVEGAPRVVAVPATPIEGPLAGAIGAKAKPAPTRPVEEVLNAAAARAVARVRRGVRVATRSAVDTGVGTKEVPGVAAVDEAGRRPEGAKVAPGAGAPRVGPSAPPPVGRRRALPREAATP